VTWRGIICNRSEAVPEAASPAWHAPCSRLAWPRARNGAPVWPTPNESGPVSALMSAKARRAESWDNHGDVCIVFRRCIESIQNSRAGRGPSV
jgi:hypothetical protein